MAIERELQATSTAERISALEALGELDHHSAGQLQFAHQLFLKLKLESSLEKVLHKRQTGHFFYPEEWTEWEQQDLKRAFKAVEHLHGLLKAHFVL
jgi:signal-transduction protein with cAMP-binding, CBS, and nucleotidyltransferase domain